MVNFRSFIGFSSSVHGSFEVGSKVSKILNPNYSLLATNYSVGQSYVFVDGETVFTKFISSLTACNEFCQFCKNYYLTLEERVHRMSFSFPIKGGRVIVTHFIVPSVHGVPVVDGFDLRNEVFEINWTAEEHISNHFPPTKYVICVN